MKQIEQKTRHARSEGLTDEQLNGMLAILREYHRASAEHMRDFCPQAEDIQEQLDWIDVLCPAKWQKNHGGKVYVRTFRTPLHDLRELFLERPSQLEQVMAYEKDHAGAAQKELCEVLCTYWIDGRRSREEIIAHTEAESGASCRWLLEDYLDLLEKLELIKTVK